MIYIITAIYAEAHALINRFQLKKDLSHTRFQVFRDKEAKLCLVISGTGLIPASVAVSSICTEYGAGQQDFLFNVGACAGIRNANMPETGKDCQTGAIFLCNKITEQITGKTFYPDILYQHGFAEAPIITGAKPYMKTPGTQGITPGERKEPDFSLYDMEASAIYQAGSYFFGPHQMYFLKIVSDDGEIQNVTSKQIQDLIDKKIESIAEYIISLQAMTSKEQTEDSYKQDTMQKSFQSLCFDLHASKAMSESVRQYIRYCVLSGIDYDSVIKEMYLEGKLPCKDKREGKQRFEELKKRLL